MLNLFNEKRKEFNNLKISHILYPLKQTLKFLIKVNQLNKCKNNKQN